MMTEQDDEGYTSPSKDGEVIGQDVQDSGNNASARLGRELCGKNRSISSDNLSSARCRVAWDQIAKFPEPSESKHISWDDLKYPFPYRSSNYSTDVQNRINLESKVFISDAICSSNAIIDRMWMLEFNDAGNRPSRAVQKLAAKSLKPAYITMTQFIGQALHLMCGRESQSFILKYKEKFIGRVLTNGTSDTLDLFTHDPSVIVHGISPGALRNFCQPFLKCGSLYKKLSRVRTPDDPTHSRRNSIDSIQRFSKRNAVFQSISTFISNYLKLYETVIMLKKDSVQTMTQLHALMTPLKCQLNALEQIVDSQINGNVVDLLTSLNELLFSVENHLVVDIIKNLFISCASAYLKYIADWIFRGELGSSMEFHITRNRKAYDGRKFWTKQFLQKEAVPEFLKESVEKIFETGKALNLLITLQPVLHSVKTSSILVRSIGEQIKAEFGFEQLRLLGDTWAEKVDSFYSENSYLVTEIQEAVLEILSHASKSLDTELFAAERAKFHKKVEQSKFDSLQREKEKKQDLYESLQNQIKVSNEYRRQRQEEERVEAKKIEEYYTKLDHEDAQGTKGFARNYFPRSHTTFDVVDGVMSTDKTVIPSSKSEPHSIVGHCGDGNGKHFQIIDIERVPIKESNSNSEKARTFNRPGPSAKAIVHETKMRFNPDKIKTRSPQPYSCPLLSDFAKPVTGSQGQPCEDFRQRRQQPKFDQFCMNEFLSSSVHIPLNAQNKMVNSILLHHIIKENMLFQHLGMINSYLCLQNGVFSHSLSELLIDEVKKGLLRSPKELYEKSYRVNTILGEAISIALENEVVDPLLKNINFAFADDLKNIPSEGSESASASKASSKFQVLNYLRLKYTVDWPINIILTEDMMSLYENIFSFLMKLIRAELLLERMFSHLKSKCSKSRQLFQLNNYRFRMLHFVRSVRNYVNITVIHTAWNELCSKFHELDSIEKIYSHLVAHVKNITSNCLLGQKAEKIMKLILNHLVVVESFCCQLDTIMNAGTSCAGAGNGKPVVKGGINWDKGEEISKQEFLELSQKYEVSEQFAKLFTESILKGSTRRAYNKVDNFLEHYNFNGFFHQPA